MGTLLYGAPPAAHACDDRVLAHLQIVITNKFRRGEGFLLSLESDPVAGVGRRALWLHPNIALRFQFEEVRMPAINPAWVRLLADEANSGRGLRILPEPSQERAAERADSAIAS
ncbi:hypothetical protein HQQ81_22170 [Microbacteriaceae bacterium VKM Ac-2854]|nr:hypothetical protein [Microbacteriaceae bacterium VKM Ac-2854]